jgi:radical SAM protein with 4Fe4S-binding SPASM domain
VSHVAVATDGTIYPCYRTVFDPRGATAVLGHVAGGRGAPEVQRAYAALDPGRPRPQDGDCESCPAQGGCALFCPALGLLLAGDIGIVPRVVCELTRAQVAVVGDFGRRLEDLSARRASGRTVFAASALALALAGASAGCGDRANPGPQGGVCPVYVDGGVGDARTDGPMAGVCADWIDGPVGGVCPVTGSDAAAGDGTALDGSPGDLLTAGDASTPLDGGPVGGLCPVQIGDGGIGGIC